VAAAVLAAVLAAAVVAVAVAAVAEVAAAVAAAAVVAAAVVAVAAVAAEPTLPSCITAANVMPKSNRPLSLDSFDEILTDLSPPPVDRALLQSFPCQLNLSCFVPETSHDIPVLRSH